MVEALPGHRAGFTGLLVDRVAGPARVPRVPVVGVTAALGHARGVEPQPVVTRPFGQEPVVQAALVAEEGLARVGTPPVQFAAVRARSGVDARDQRDHGLQWVAADRVVLASRELHVLPRADDRAGQRLVRQRVAGVPVRLRQRERGVADVVPGGRVLGDLVAVESDPVVEALRHCLGAPVRHGPVLPAVEQHGAELRARQTGGAGTRDVGKRMLVEQCGVGWRRSARCRARDRDPVVQHHAHDLPVHGPQTAGDVTAVVPVAAPGATHVVPVEREGPLQAGRGGHRPVHDRQIDGHGADAIAALLRFERGRVGPCGLCGRDQHVQPCDPVLAGRDVRRPRVSRLVVDGVDGRDQGVGPSAVDAAGVAVAGLAVRRCGDGVVVLAVDRDRGRGQSRAARLGERCRLDD